MVRLIIDTSSNKLYLGLFNELIVIRESTMTSDDISSICVERITKLLDSVNMKINDIEEFIVGIGPGSFTGLRVGLTIAKIFTFEDTSKLFTINSLYLLGSGMSHAKIYAEARNGNCYGLVTSNFQPIEHGFYKTEDFIVTNKNQWLIKIPSNDIAVDMKYVLKYRDQAKDQFVIPDYWKVPDVLTSVEPLKDKDYDKFMTIWLESRLGNVDMNLDVYKKKANSKLIIGLFIEKEIKGFILAKREKGPIYGITNLYVTPDARNHLGGTKLFDYLFQILKPDALEITFEHNTCNEIFERLMAKTQFKFIDKVGGAYKYIWRRDVNSIN